MTAYLIRRGAASIVVIFGIALLTFVMLHAIAPTPGRARAGRSGQPGRGQRVQPGARLRPAVWSQFLSYLDQLLHGNLGYSYKLNQSVNSLLAENMARSAWLSGVSLR